MDLSSCFCSTSSFYSCGSVVSLPCADGLLRAVLFSSVVCRVSVIPPLFVSCLFLLSFLVFRGLFISSQRSSSARAHLQEVASDGERGLIWPSNHFFSPLLPVSKVFLNRVKYAFKKVFGATSVQCDEFSLVPDYWRDERTLWERIKQDGGCQYNAPGIAIEVDYDRVIYVSTWETA